MKHIRSHVAVLSHREIETIHRASLEILADVGIEVPNDVLLERLRAVGAEVHGERARLPAVVIERMLAACVGPRGNERASRRRFQQGEVRVTNGSEMMLLSYPEHIRRPGTLDDVLRGIALTNTLPTIGWALPVVVPADVPLEVAPLAAYRLGCLYSTKPFNVYFGLQQSPYLMEMAGLVAEARGVAKRELGLSFGFGIVSPLRLTADDLACAVAMAGNGFHANCYSFITVGATGPASMAGALALSNAERLACLTLMWLWGEIGGYTEGFVDDPCMIEPRTLATSFAHPNLTTLAIATGQLSRFYGLGAGGGGLALSDSKWIDYQDGFERGMGAAFCILAGGGIGNSGIVGPDEAMSFEQLVIDDASLSAINWIRQGIEVTDDALALGIIKEVGIGGGYLDQEHTVRYLRKEYWESPIFTRLSWSDWERGGRETLMERAHREVERILAQGYPPQPLLPEAVDSQLQAIVGRARRELIHEP